MEPEKSTESNATKNMFSVVQRMNAGYEQFFDSKPKASGIRSECYSNYCGTTSKSVVTTDEGSTSEPASECGRNIVEQFFPQADEPEPNQCQPYDSDGRSDEPKQCQRVIGGGCSKYLPVTREKF